MADSRFTTTSWSLVLAAGDDNSGRAREALNELCSAYWYPIYSLIRREGASPDEAADLTQSYLVQLLDKRYLRQVSPDLGKFRSFLYVSVKHFLSNERDRERAAKRGGGRPPVSLDAAAAEERYSLEPADTLTPEKLFERRWATTVLERAMHRLRSEAGHAGDPRRFDRLQAYVSGKEPAPAYRDVAAELGMTETALGVAVHRMRRKFGQILREEIAQTVADPREVDGEIRFLLGALGGS